MRQRSIKSPNGFLFLAIIAMITAAVVFGLASISDDVRPFEERHFWLAVGIALAPILAMAGALWLVQSERYKSRGFYFYDACGSYLRSIPSIAEYPNDGGVNRLDRRRD